MQPNPTIPISAQPMAGGQRRFLLPVLVGTVLMLVEAILIGVTNLILSFSFTSNGTLPDPGILAFLDYLYPLGILVGGIGAFLALYGIAVGVRVLLARAAPMAAPSGNPGTGLAAPPVPVRAWWARSPYQFVLVGAVLVLVAAAISLTMEFLSIAQIYPSTATVGDFLRVTSSVNFVVGLLGSLGTVLAYVGIAVAMDRATS